MGMVWYGTVWHVGVARYVMYVGHQNDYTVWWIYDREKSRYVIRYVGYLLLLLLLFPV